MSTHDNQGKEAKHLVVPDYYKHHPTETERIRTRAIEKAKELSREKAENEETETFEVKEVVWLSDTVSGRLRFYHYGVMIGNYLLHLEWKHDNNVVVGVEVQLELKDPDFHQQKTSSVIGTTAYTPGIAHGIGT